MEIILDKNTFTNAMHMASYIIYVDESGNPGITSIMHNLDHPFFIIGFCYCKNPSILKRKCMKLLTNLHRKHQYPKSMKELKFFPTLALQHQGCTLDDIQSKWAPHYDMMREKMLEIIVNNSDGVFAGIVNKTKIKPKSCLPEEIDNTLFQKSFEYVLPQLDISTPLLTIYDRGRLSVEKSKKFNAVMEDVYHKYTDNFTNIPTHHKTFHDSDSIKTPGIWVADFIAGAFHFAIKHNNTKYRDLLKPRFIKEGSKMFDL